MSASGPKIGRLAARLAFIIVALGCVIPAYRHAKVNALRANAPLQAAQIAPNDSKVLVNVLGSRLDDNPEFRLSAEDFVNIRTSLIDQPLEPKLLSIIGLAYEASGDTARAARAMHVANRVSRRDSVSGLYLIENASASGDVRETLKRYNAVLLTQPGLNAALLPILSSAIAYPEIRTELRAYLQADAKWASAFLIDAAEKASVIDLQALLLPLPKPLFGQEYAPVLARVLHRIAVERDRTEALGFVDVVIPGLPVGALSDLSFNAATLDKRLGQFSWTFPPVDGVEVEVGDAKSIKINAAPLSRGAVAVRDLLLEAGGKYQLVQRPEYELGSGRVNVRWSANCVNLDGVRPFWEQKLPASGGQTVYRSELTVPQDCKVVRLTLFAEGPDGQMPSMLTIRDLFLSKAN